MSFTNVPSFPLPSSGTTNEIYKLPDDSIWYFDSVQWLPLQSPLVSPMSFGATGNGVADDSTFLEECIDFCRDNNHIMLIDRQYKTSKSLKMHNTKVFSSNGKIICNDTILNDFVIDVAGFDDSDTELITSDLIKGTQYLTCESIEIPVSKGDLIRVFSNKEFSTEEGVKQGEIQKVDEVIIETVESIDYYKIKIYGSF